MIKAIVIIRILHPWFRSSGPGIFEQIELQAKLLNYFLGSNKSNINQKPADFGERFFFGLFWWPAGKGRWSAVGKKWESRAVSVVKL